MTIRCGDVYEEYALNEIFIEAPDLPIRRRMRKQQSVMKMATLHTLSFHATSLLNLQGRYISSNKTPSSSARQAMTKYQVRHKKSSTVGPNTDVRNVESTVATGRAAASRNPSGATVVAIDSCTTPKDGLLLLITSIDSLFTIGSVPFCRVCQ